MLEGKGYGEFFVQSGLLLNNSSQKKLDKPFIVCTEKIYPIIHLFAGQSVKQTSSSKAANSLPQRESRLELDPADMCPVPLLYGAEAVRAALREMQQNRTVPLDIPLPGIAEPYGNLSEKEAITTW